MAAGSLLAKLVRENSAAGAGVLGASALAPQEAEAGPIKILSHLCLIIATKRNF